MTQTLGVLKTLEFASPNNVKYLCKKVQCHSLLVEDNLRSDRVFTFAFFFSLSCWTKVNCQDFDDQDGPYRGKFIGKFNSYHHQVGGDVYAVDANTFLIVGFNYDGNGIDTFFWSGASNRPGPQGFIVPDEFGK